MVESFWSIPSADAVRTPLTLLREQATALTQQTKGALVGTVETSPVGDYLVIELSIQVPALNNYKLRLLSYHQPMAMYPGGLSTVSGDSIDVGNEEEFERSLKEILSSDKVSGLVGSLLSQATAA
jgi:hypothetical protein